MISHPFICYPFIQINSYKFQKDMNLNKPKLKIIISISIQSSNLIDFNYITKAQKQMLRPTSYGSFMQQKPRKKLKLDTVNEKVYNEFEGNSDVE